MRIRCFRKKRRGAGVVEYGMLVGLVAVGAIIAVQNSGGAVSSLLNTVASELDGVRNDVGGVRAGEGVTIAPAVPSAPTGCATIGSACDDGTIYAGDIAYDGTTYDLYVPASDQADADWSAQDQIVVAGSDGYDGYANTQAAAASSFTTPAADLCWNLAEAGRNDWYLPASAELQVLSGNSAAIGGFDTTSSWPGSYYWTSTETDADHAASLNFATNQVDTTTFRANTLPIRCVRRVAR